MSDRLLLVVNPYLTAALLKIGAENFSQALLPNYDVFDEHRYFEPGLAILYSRSHPYRCHDLRRLVER